MKEKPKIYKKHVAEKILDAIFIGGFVVPAMLTSPFGLYAIAVGTGRYYFNKKEFNRTIRRLDKRGYIALTKKDKNWMLKLLPKGKKRIKKQKINHLKLPKEKNWDRKWRLLSFDIPEEYKNKRDTLRKKLKSLGCFNIQRSLFVYPFDCRQELDLITEYYEVKKHTLYAEVSYLDFDKELREHFGLK